MHAKDFRKSCACAALLFFLCVVSCVAACGQQPKPKPEQKAESSPASEPLVPDVGEGWLSFAIQGPEPEPNSDATMFHATYRAEGKVARFDFELNVKPPSADGLQFGRFIAVPGSDASVLLRNLKTTLAAKKLPTTSTRVSELPFAFVLMGNDLSHADDGGMSPDPRGHWTAMKLFIGHEKDDAEVFLNFNTSLHKAEFSIKDEEYGDTLLRYLAKVL
jgi:hypothetical protein